MSVFCGAIQDAMYEILSIDKILYKTKNLTKLVDYTFIELLKNQIGSFKHLAERLKDQIK